MKKVYLLAIIVVFTQLSFGQYDGNTTPTYPNIIEAYQVLANRHKEIELFNMGESDYGLPIYLCIINGEDDSLRTMEKARSGTTLLINNAIHPGEPDGVNACLQMLNDWIKSGKQIGEMPLVGIIPAYNVGGMMNRSNSSRANQDGPEEYGFRGNAQNLDLNRDFIKMDSKNAFTFVKIYHALEPDVFIDTHVSNGADYQYTLSYIAGVREKMAPELGELMHEELIPNIKKTALEFDFDMIPYVNLKDKTPDKGIVVFNDLPRYAMGYASLMNSMSFTIETHMLKPFPDRVKATYSFILGTINWMMDNGPEIESARSKAEDWERDMAYYKYNYRVSSKHDSILFKGYEYSNPISEVTSLSRLKYHRDQPYERNVPYFNFYIAQDSTFISDFYVVEAQCSEVLERLKANNVEMLVLEKDSLIQLGNQLIGSYNSPEIPYEGHFLHSNIVYHHNLCARTFKKGDVIISTHQKNKRFIISVLEPNTNDSYFAWNFFDSYVQQKEYFSAYVFEDKAMEILKENPLLKEKLEKKKVVNKEFRESSWQQLYFIYKHSKYYEPSHNYLPIYSGMDY